MRRIPDAIVDQPRRLLLSGLRALAWSVVIAVPTLVTPPAAAQNPSAWLSPQSPEVRESAGEVVLTVSMWRPGRVSYRTFDGPCDVSYGPAGGAPSPTCSDGARAPEDYTATSGELVFTTEGSKTIRIPIVDDALAEGGERFTVAAWEEANADPWLERGDGVTVGIRDDEGGTSVGKTSVQAQRSSTPSSTRSGTPISAAPARISTTPPSSAAPDEPIVALEPSGVDESQPLGAKAEAVTGVRRKAGLIAMLLGAMAVGIFVLNRKLRVGPL